MKVYIRSAGNISPQHSLDTELFFSTRLETREYTIRCIEPDYSAFVDVKMIRRMSRIVKMGVAAALTCLRNAEVKEPSAIITATAYGCLEDSASFLRRMIEFEEKLLSPTAFIQSTHNTVGAQIALLLKCHQYNNTLVHRDYSFENALMESRLLLEEGIRPVLVGAVDENTDDRQAILSRFGLYRKDENQSGNIAGEGASFFLLDSEPGNNPLAMFRDLSTLTAMDTRFSILAETGDFLSRNQMRAGDIDLVLHSGNTGTNQLDRELMRSLFRETAGFPFESLCGVYPTSTGFALWFASILLKEQRQPVWMEPLRWPIKNILIDHHDGNTHHSLMLVSAC